MKKNIRNKKGSILPIAVFLLTTFIAASATGVDISYYANLRSSIEKATEAAATAGAQEYFRSGADAGKAVNEAMKIYKLNVSTDTMIGNFYNPTGMGQPSTLTYSNTFTSQDSLSWIYRDQPITVTVVTEQARGKITVTSETTAKPYFAQIFGANTNIKVKKVAELPPYDVVFVDDLSGSMRFATVNTYIGTAYVQISGMSGLGTLYNDVILYQSQNERWGRNSVITANGLVTTINRVTDVVINTPAFDIPTSATYSNSQSIYVSNPDRGFIVSTNNSNGLRRTALSGYRISNLQNENVSAEDKVLAQTYNLNRSLNATDVTTYFNRAAGYIEPHASSVYGVMAFIDTVRVYGAAALKLGLVTFESNSYTNDRQSNWTSPELRANSISKIQRRLLPYVGLVDPSSFNTIVDKLTIMTTGGNGLLISPLQTNSYPNGGTNINGGLDNAKWTLDRSDRPNSEKIIILFTDGEPSHSFSALGTKVKSLTDAGIKIYSIVLTLAVTQNTIDQFKYQMEEVGKAEPVIFISDPAKLKDAFLQIADELGLKLVN